MKDKTIQRSSYLRITAWSISFVVILLAFVAWGEHLQWQFTHLTTYDVFPLFGLLAFSIMWSHYMAVELSWQFKITDKAVLYQYFRVTSFVVLAAICLHPGLLIWQLWRDGQGLPPSSYLHYVKPGLRFAVLLSTASLFIFLAYELKRWYGTRKWWRFVGYASDLAMLAIFIHSLTLGTQIVGGWFRGVWFFYGASLVVVLLHKYIRKYNHRRLQQY